jgi:hypothetical protein
MSISTGLRAGTLKESANEAIIGHIDFDKKPPSRAQIIMTGFPYRELVFQAENMADR